MTEMSSTKFKFKVSKEAIDLMNDTLIHNINYEVKTTDYFFILGDIAFSDNKIRECLDRINCKNIFFIWGNHDKVYNINNLAVLGNYEQCLVSIQGNRDNNSNTSNKDNNSNFRAVLNHYPLDVWENPEDNIKHLYGHCHGNANYRRSLNPYYRNSIDVGVDSNNYFPWSLEELVSYFDKQEHILSLGQVYIVKDFYPQQNVCLFLSPSQLLLVSPILCHQQTHNLHQ